MTKERATELLVRAQQFVNENFGYLETRQILNNSIGMREGGPELLENPMEIAHHRVFVSG